MNIHTEIIHRVESNEFDRACEEIYGRNPDFVANQEANNGASYEYDVNGDLMDYEEKDLSEWKAGNLYFINAAVLLNDLARNGHIPKGNYLITVFW